MALGPPIIREAKLTDRSAAVETLVESMQAGTFIGYLTSHARDQRGALSAYFRLVFDGSGRRIVSDDLSGVALWDIPGGKTSVIQDLKLIPIILRFDFSVLRLSVRVMRGRARVKPKIPHYHLSTLGVLSSRQGRGVGAALVRFTLAESDRARVGAYLETGNPRNIPFYEKLGFKLRETISIPGVEIPIATMWRNPVS